MNKISNAEEFNAALKIFYLFIQQVEIFLVKI